MDGKIGTTNKRKFMKVQNSSILLAIVLLSGCATNTDNLYYDTVRSISKDQTMAQAACWSAVTEIAKSSSDPTKTTAILFAEKCKINPIQLEKPKRNILGF